MITDVLVGAGFDEVYTLPLLAPSDLTRAGYLLDEAVEVENPLRAEESILRPALLPGVLRAAAFNAAHGAMNVALFEDGTVFAPPSTPRSATRSNPDATLTAATERFHVAMVRTGAVTRTPYEADRAVVSADMVAVVEALAGELRLLDWALAARPAPGFHPARVASVLVDGVEAGVVGEIAQEVREALGLAANVVACELDVAAVLAGTRAPRFSRPVSRFPASSIDLAFVVPDTEPAGAVRRTLVAGGGELLEDVRLFDVFRSDALGPDRVSLAFACSLRAPDRTLTDEEVATVRQACIDAVTAAHAAELRGVSDAPRFVHRIRVRYAEVDGQGVVFNAHWLTYFDDACTRFMESLGFGVLFWIAEFDVMLVKAVVEWSGPARFDEWLDIAVAPVRIGQKSFDLHYTATVDGLRVCMATITYVSVQTPSDGVSSGGTASTTPLRQPSSTDIPDHVRAALADRLEG